MQRVIFSPLLVFLLGAIAFEFVVRVPTVAIVLNSGTMSHQDQLHFFSVHQPQEVFFLGLMMVSLALVYVLATTLVIPARIYTAPLLDPPPVSAAIYPIALLFLAASMLAALSIDATDLQENISGKREELELRGLTWVWVKMSNFNHIIFALVYIKVCRENRLFDKGLLALTFLALALNTIFFSQRAVLIGFFLEVLYLQLLLGTFRASRTFGLFVVIFAVLLTISALRPGTEYDSSGAAIFAAFEKMATSRYFFDFTKLGSVLIWAEQGDWLGPIVIGFVLKPFFWDQVYFYKEIGPMIAQNVYFYRSETGVTPGLLLESILSFGYLIGYLFFFFVILFFRVLERRLIIHARSLAGILFLVMAVSKLSLALNSSLGAYAFQLMLEGVFLGLVLLVLFVFRPRQGSREAPMRPLRPGGY